MRAFFLAIGLAMLAVPAAAQDVDAGRRTFETRCGRCHGAEGGGTEMGPAIVQRLKARDDQQLATLIHDGIPLKYTIEFPHEPSNPTPSKIQATAGSRLASVRE